MRLSRRAVLFRDSPSSASGRSTGIDPKNPNTPISIAPNPISAAAEALYSSPPTPITTTPVSTFDDQNR